MDTHRIRNLIPPVYGILVVLGFLISTIAGVIVLIVGGALSGVLWSSLSGARGRPSEHGTRDERLAARAERRSERR